jgi:signal peptidase I
MKKKIIIILSALAIISVVYFLISHGIYNVSGTSMNPNFNEGESIVANKFSYLLKEPERGDVVVVEEEGKKYLKRVVGLSEELISIKDCKIYINDNLITEYYIKGNCTFGNQNVSLGKDQYYVLGDNREPNQSTDSRIYGPITKSKIIGQVIYKWDGWIKEFDKGNYQFGI